MSREIREYIQNRHKSLLRRRQPWDADYKELSRFTHPRAGRFDNEEKINPNTRSTDIIDSTARFSLRTLVAGMVAGNTSPARPWLKVGLEDYDLQGFGPVKTWLAEAQKAAHNVFRRSNLYGALPIMYRDQGLFGTGFGLALDDPDSLMRVYPWTVGTYCLAVDHRGIVDTAYKEFPMTALQIAKQFGKANMSRAALQMLEKNPDERINVIVAIEPRVDRDPRKIDNLNMPWRSVWMESAADGDKILRESGFREWPGIAPRWEVNELDAYGSGPGIDTLADNKHLQFNQKMKALNVDLMGNPPRSAPTSLRNQPVGGMPGDITYFDAGAGGQKIEPTIQPNPQAIREIREDVAEIQERIRKGFYVDTFLMLATRDRGEAPTAREVDELHLEKMIELGPVVERVYTDMQLPLTKLTFSKMIAQSKPIWDGLRDGKPLLPPPPTELKDAELRFEFIGLMSQAQKSTGMLGIERVFGFAGQHINLTGDNSILDGLDGDAALQEYAEMAGPPPRIVRSPKQIASMRASREQQTQAQNALAAAEVASKAAKNVGGIKTDENNLASQIINGGRK